MKPLRVLFTNSRLSQQTGTELVVRDLALGLLRRGHRPVVFSPRLGPLAEALRQRGVPVVDDLANVGEPPDLIHGQHHVETMIALLRFPGVPGVYVCHDRLGWTGWAPAFPRLVHHVAVDENCRDRLVNEQGIPPDRVRVIFNAVDLERFQPRSALPERPRRALMFSNYADELGYLPAVRAGCAAAGLNLEVAGLNSHSATDAPERLLPGFDVVFGKARCALEAMACGAAVVLCDFRGLGPLVTTANLDLLRRQNFGMRALQDPITADGVKKRLAAYDATDAARVSCRIRSEAGLEGALDQWLGLYDEVRSGAATDPIVTPDDESRAAAAYLQAINQKLPSIDAPPFTDISWRMALRRVLRPLLPLSARDWLRYRRLI